MKRTLKKSLVLAAGVFAGAMISSAPATYSTNSAATSANFGLSASNSLAPKPTHFPAKAKHIIFLYMDGGPSHLDLFDLKPNAPSEIRGPFQTIPTKTPGVIFTEHCRDCAKITDKFTVVRSHTHTDNGHATGYHYVMTGRRPTFADGEYPIPTNELYPSLGSIIGRELGSSGTVPPYINMPHPMLKSGLIALYTPGPAMLAAEPEVALRIASSAQSLLMVLGKELANSSRDVWKQYAQNSQAHKFVVLDSGAGADASTAASVATALELADENVLALPIKQAVAARLAHEESGDLLEGVFSGMGGRRQQNGCEQSNHRYFT